MITILAVAIFLTLKIAMGFQFGLRTYWPGFVCLYLIAWFYLKTFRAVKESNQN